MTSICKDSCAVDSKLFEAVRARLDAPSEPSPSPSLVLKPSSGSFGILSSATTASGPIRVFKPFASSAASQWHSTALFLCALVTGHLLSMIVS